MTRPVHIWLAFTLCAAVLLSVMGWVSRTTLLLDRLQAEAVQTADLEERARLALWRLDSWLTSLIIEESARGYTEYEAFAAGPQAYRGGVDQIEPGEMLMPSSLLWRTPSHVLLHFQLHPDGRVSSPQAPTGHQRDLAEAGHLSREHLEKAAQRLDAFRHILGEPAGSRRATDFSRPRVDAALPGSPNLTGDNHAAMLMRETARPVDIVPATTRASREELAHQAQPGSSPFDAAAQASQMTERQLFRNEAEFNFRANTVQQAQQRLSLQNALQQADSPRMAAPPQTAATEAVIRAFWLGDALVLARRVNPGPDFVIQGCWLDWTSLRQLLLDSIRDLFPNAVLEPVTRPLDEPNARRLATLPVELLTGSPAPGAPAAWTPLRLALLVAWTCVLIAVVAVGFLLRGTLNLSERRAAFVSSVTHELRTPLTTFRLYSEMLSEGMVSDDTARKAYLATLCAEANRLTHLVENVLAYARLERTTASQRQERIALGDLIERVKPRLVERTGQAGLTLVEEAGERARSAVVRVDIAAVEQILFNLVDNACKYAAPTATRRILHLEARPHHRKFIGLRVRDHGPGLTVEAIRRLFQPFAKSAQAAAETASGVGLGLALSRRLSRGLGGDLRLDRDVEEGAAFLLLLPLAAR